MHETWYVLEDGSPADPAEVAPDDAGTLRHKHGMAVAYTQYGPRSRSMSAAEIEAARAGRQAPKRASREMKPKGAAAGYETR